MEKKLKIIYMCGGTTYTITPLKKLINSQHNVACVYIKQPKPSGRGRKLKESPLLEFVKELDFVYRTPLNFKEASEISFLKEINADFFVVFSYGIILPKEVLKIPKYGCINIHASLLPKWRGPSPVQYSLINNEKKTGFSFMKMDEGIDTGDILFKKEININNDDNTISLLNKISELSGNYLVRILEDYSCKRIPLIKQDESEATYSFKIKKKSTFILFNEEAKAILGKIKAYYPNPTAKCIIKGEVLKILEAKVEEEETVHRNFGITIDNKLLIACKKGSIRLTRIQRQGKKALSTEEVLNGWKIEKGTKLHVQ